MAEMVTAKKVEDIKRGTLDSAGYKIVSVYSYNPPDYAIYRTSERLIVQFSDQAELALAQRRRISPLAPMRGQINALIDGWRIEGLEEAEAEIDEEQGRAVADDGNTGWLATVRAQLPGAEAGYLRACRYDRRVADALITVLDAGDGDAKALETAQTLLAQVKNDILSERTAIARIKYVRWALGLVAVMIALTWVLASTWFGNDIHRFALKVAPVWTAIAGGSIGAFFSAAVGLKGRTLAIDLQWRENLVDVLLRILIGAIAGGVFYALLISGMVSTPLFDVKNIVHHANPLKDYYSDFNVFMVGFIAGFIERLVPQLLNDTNIGTPEPTGKDTPNGAPPGGGEDGKGSGSAKGKETPAKDAPAKEAPAKEAPVKGRGGAGTGGAATPPAAPAAPAAPAPGGDPTGGTG